MIVFIYGFIWSTSLKRKYNIQRFLNIESNLNLIIIYIYFKIVMCKIVSPQKFI